ncbi:MAG: flavocytochrome C [Betaproteobacteria bacterium HGW-Betaproteobacteria-1]|jgi:NADPH-dependent 2,4-dienoyl-CoA reductase/sulfur reductase-like enzyme|nr:MAG: flavocytochrome C [Betaproteobacteria bacterium HGW-Betaproteobacteria-1]
MTSTPLNRREFIKWTAAASALASIGGCTQALVQSSGNQPRVVVIGGGYAGSAVAKYLRIWSNAGIETVVIEPNPYFVSCPLSNLVLGGSKQIEDLSFSYESLKRNHGIHWVKDTVVAVDATSKKIRTARGELHYDKLVLAPGIDFILDDLPMLQSEEAQLQIPHAWKAGPQTVNLHRQLAAMPEGGVFAISIPKAPYRCPPGPYERVCQAAFYLKQHNPTAKIIVLDANPDIVSKKGLFLKVWSEMYAGMVDYRPNSSIVDLDVTEKRVTTEFEQVRADVLNVIPPQRAGKVAQMLGVVNVDQRWCEVDFRTYESAVLPDVHIVGDAVSAGLPKSAHMATSQARVCASAIVAAFSGIDPDPLPVFANTCYSFVSDNMAMHVAHVYRYDPVKRIMLPADGGGVSDAPSVQEGSYAYDWARNIWSDVLT